MLIVGAGGIGCELIKNLVLCGFDDLTMIDLDTIDYSNLNRQFLFRKHHVNKSKAETARESALAFPHDAGLEIVAHHGNIKNTAYDLAFFETFNVVLNALDNVEARRHVNRLCLTGNVPLVESGTEGYLGQVRAILKGKCKCYECDPPPPPKTFPICTIRNHPDKDVRPSSPPARAPLAPRPRPRRAGRVAAERRQFEGQGRRRAARARRRR